MATGIATDRYGLLSYPIHMQYLLFSYLSSSIGSVNFIAPMTVIAGILTYAWPFAKDEGSLIVIAIVYG